MSYYNILYKYGLEKFILDSKKAGIQGFIVPDLPPEDPEPEPVKENVFTEMETTVVGVNQE